MFQVSLITEIQNSLTKTDYTAASFNEVKKKARQELSRLGLDKNGRYTIWWRLAGIRDYKHCSLGNVEYTIGREILE